MARDRLSWDKEKAAELEKKADPYTMNQDHPNPPASKYDIGGPSEFAEDPDMKTPWKQEGRDETGHPAPAARQAVKAARQLEDKALKCITIAQRMLPGATDTLIEDQATDLMYIPEGRILATLQRQASFAESLASDDNDEDDKEEKEEKEAAKKEVEKEEVEEEEKEAAKKEEVEEEEEKEAAKKEEVEEEEEKEAAKKEVEKEEIVEEEEVKEASNDIDLNTNVDLLDSIFASEAKTGAKTLSGIVKQASGNNSLDGLWNAPPDVSEAFR